MLTNVLQNNCLNKIWDHWHCNSFNSVYSFIQNKNKKLQVLEIAPS